MTYGRYSNIYHKTSISTSGKLDLVIQCYDKTIESIYQAKNYYQDKEFEKKGKSLTKALALIHLLQSGLNLEKGGQIATNLDSIYTYLKRRLAEGDLKKDLCTFDEAIRIMSDLKEAWEQILDQEQDQSPGVADRPSQEHHFSQIAV